MPYLMVELHFKPTHLKISKRMLDYILVHKIFKFWLVESETLSDNLIWSSKNFLQFLNTKYITIVNAIKYIKSLLLLSFCLLYYLHT